jgi:hypothetical protein
MLLPSSGIDGADAILDAVHTQLIGTHTDNRAMFEVCGIGDGIIVFLVPLPGDPDVAKDRDRPVSRWNVAERVEDKRLNDELVHGKKGKQAKGQYWEWYDSHDFFQPLRSWSWRGGAVYPLWITFFKSVFSNVAELPSSSFLLSDL